MKRLLLPSLLLFILSSCQKKESATEPAATTTGSTAVTCPTCNFPDSVFKSSATGPMLIFKFRLDSTLARLNNSGQPATIPQGNAAQSPRFNGISANSIELSEADDTPPGSGTVLYRSEETECGGSPAIVFCKSVVCKNGDVFFSLPLSQVKAGSYKWLRVSVAYQNYDVKVKTVSGGIIDGTIASFVGFNTYVSKYKMKGTVMTPTITAAQNKQQGYWGFYADLFGVPSRSEGLAPITTVVNPNPSSPIPAGSSVITGELYSNSASALQPLVITGSETQDITITVSLSTNKSFEWKERTGDGYFQPEIGEYAVDMGLRGMVPRY